MTLGIGVLGPSDPRAQLLASSSPSCLALAVWHKLLGVNVCPLVCARVDIPRALVLKECYADQQWQQLKVRLLKPHLRPTESEMAPDVEPGALMSFLDGSGAPKCEMPCSNV